MIFFIELPFFNWLWHLSPRITGLGNKARIARFSIISA
jgi:hypothetical protein